MKKVIGLITAIILIILLIYFNTYTTVRTFDMDGYVFTSDNITNNLINGESTANEKVEYSKVKYSDSLYEGRGQYYIGDRKKVNINIDYPIVSTNSNTLLILSENDNLVDSDYRKTKTYTNTFVSDNKLYNENDYERADNINYIFIELKNSIFINLSEIKVKSSKENIIPVNSFVSFSEENLRYYYLVEGKYIYKEISGLDKKTTITIDDKSCSYETFLEKLGLFVPEEEIPDIDIAPEVEEEEPEEIIIEETPKEEEEVTEEVEEKQYVKPTVTFDSQNAKVYSMTGKLEITDPTNQIVKYPTFEFWKGKSLFLRKTFVTPDTIEIKGLYPGTEYTVIGTFNYKNENDQEVKSEFVRFTISTKDISNLEKILFNIDKITPSFNYAEFSNIYLNNKENDEVLKGIKKVILNIGSNSFQLGAGVLTKLIKLEKQDYTTSKSLTSNTKYDVSVDIYDVAGNQLEVESKEYSFKTTKQAPSGSLTVRGREISRVSLKFDIVNKDDINIANRHYVIFDSAKNLIKDVKTDDLTVTVDSLDANEVYTLYLYGDYDLEDGEGIKKDQLILDGNFSTEPISTLGYVKIDFTDITTDTHSVKFKININNETNKTLISLLTNLQMSLKDGDDNSTVKNFKITKEQLQQLMSGETLDFSCNTLDSNHTYYFDLLSNIMLGSKNYDIKTLSNINNIKTLREEAEIQIINKFVTQSMIDFDVRVYDKDEAIQSGRVLLEARDNRGVLVYYQELEINKAYFHVNIDKLTKDEYYDFKYIVEEYNIGHDNKTFQSDIALYEERIITEEGLSGSVAIESLLKQITSKNVFDIKNSRRWKTVGSMDVERRKVSLAENTISLGAKNGYRTYSYYLPEYKGKQVTVSFKIKYADKNNTKPIFICDTGAANCATAQITGIKTDDWISYTRTLTINSSNPYVSFNIREDAGENNITTIVIKDLQIEAGSSATGYVPYKEKNNYMGTFITNLKDKNHEIPQEDFHYYLRFYKGEKLLDTVEFNFNDQYEVINALYEHEIEPSSNYNVKLSVKKKITSVTPSDGGYRFYDLANLNFTSDDEIRTIRSYSEFLAIHTSGFYLVAEDLDFRNQTGYIDLEFNGIIDFQGHKIYRDTSTDGANGTSTPRMFTRIGSNGVLRNMDLHYYFDGNARGEYQGIAYYNYGTIENIMVTLEQGNNKANTVISLVVRENYGIVRNFVVNAKEALSLERDGAFVAVSNYGYIINGYLYGKPLNATFPNNALSSKYVAVVARYCNTNAYLANIFSLIDVDLNQNATTASYQYEVGNIIGPSTRAILKNIYTYSSGTYRNKSKDVNVYSGTMNVSNVYYATMDDYSGDYSNKVSPNALKSEKFQSIINEDNAFDIDNFVKYGYYPHLIWPDVMPNQEYIPLPSEDSGNVDFLNIESKTELEDESVEAVLVFQNPGYDTITNLSFDNGLQVKILSQENASNRSKVTVKFSSPSVYISKYSLTKISYKNAAGITGNVTYGAKQRIVQIDMYKNIHNMNEFKSITSNTNQNFKLQTDLNFENIDFNITTFTGKLDGNNHTIKNIRETNKNFINTLNGGTIKNLIIDTYVKNGPSAYGGFIGTVNGSANIDNVHLKNVTVTDSDTYVGGFIGYTDGALISNCSMTNVHVYETDKNNIKYSGRYGAFVGQNNNTIIQNSYVQGANVEILYASSTYGIGGFVGRHGSGYIQDCYVEGTVTTNQQEVGGVVGFNSAYIERVLSAVDVYTKQDSVGGIAGYSTNQTIFNTLVIGNVYTSKNAINQNRTIGNQTAVNSNYSWDQQLVSGANASTTNGDILLSTEELKSFTTFEQLIKFGDQFDLSKLENGKGHNLIPKLKYLFSDKLLPFQEDIEYYVDDFGVDDVVVNKAISDATIQIFINNPEGYTIKDLSIEGLKIDKVNRNVYSEGQTIYEVHVTPERYFDSYMIDKITYMKGGNEVSINPGAMISLTFYKDIGTFEDWQKIDGDVYENYRLVNDIDFAGKTNVKTRVSFNRLEGADNGHTLKNITFSATSGHVGLIDTVASDIENITFENITINSTSTTAYTGIIRFLNGTMYNVNFNTINISSKGSYVGSVAFNQSPDIKNINLNNVTISGVSYLGGFIGISRYFDITHVTANYVNVTGTHYIGGIMGSHDSSTYPTMFNFTVNHATIKGSNYVGGIFGLGACNYAIATDVHITGASYVGGIAGQEYVTYINYASIKDSDVTGSGNDIGGAYGYSYSTSYTYVDHVKVTATRANNTNNVGGISGRGGYGVYYSGIKNSTIENAGNYTGGIRGKLEYATVDRCYVKDTTVKGANYVGGVAGWHSSTSSAVIYTISNAEVTATGNYAGGLIGLLDNLNTTSATQKIYLYRNIVAGSKITSAGNLAGSLAPNTKKLPFDSHFYDNFIVADVKASGSADLSKFFIGNDDANYTNTALLRAIRVYDKSTYNGKAISDATNLPSNVTKYTAAQLKQTATFQGLLVNNYNFSQVVNGKYPYYTWQWNGSGIEYFDLPTGAATASLPLSNSINMPLPEVNVYASDVDKINIELSRVDGDTKFTINDKSYPVDKLSYTFNYDYQEDFSIDIANSYNSKTIKVSSDELKGYSSVNGNDYYFIDDNEIISNNNDSLKNMSNEKGKYNFKLLDNKFSSKVLPLKNTDNKDITPVNIYDNKVLLSNQNIYDLDKKRTIDNSFENLTLVTKDTPLYTFDYGNNKINTFYNYSVINGQIVDKQVFVKDGSLEVIDSTLQNVKDNILIDEYNGDSHLIYLGTDGKLHSLKDDVSFPKRFKNSNIKSISTDINNNSDIVFVLYNNFNWVVFNYRNGNIIDQYSKNDNDLFSYFASTFSNSKVSNKKASNYKESLDLIEKIEDRSINKVLGVEKEKDEESLVRDTYTTVYNPVTEKYEIYSVPNINDDNSNRDNLDLILNSSSTTNTINNNPVLFNYYIGRERKNKTIIISALAIVLCLITGIGISVLLLKRNLRKQNVQK